MKNPLENVSPEHLPILLGACPLGVALCRDGSVAFANAKLLYMLGAEDNGEVVGKPTGTFVAGESSAAFQDLLTSARDSISRDPADCSAELKLLGLDGAIIDVEVTVYAADLDLKPAIVLYVRDLARRKSSTAQLLSAKEELEKLVMERTAVAEERLMQLRAMAVKLTRVEHSERRRLARILHDRVQQSLVAAKFALAVMPGRDENHAAFAAWKSVAQMIDESIECSRSLSVELCPPVLYTSGLPEALAWLARQKKDQGLLVDLSVDPDAKPASDEVAAFLYEAVSELLFNVIKHAQVKRARLSLGQIDANVIEIMVSDEGAGCDPWSKQEEKSGATGLGLLGIRERLLHMGCGFHLESALGKGTCVWLRAPRRLKQSAGDSDLASGVLDVERPGHSLEKNPSSGSIRVLLVDDHEIVRKGVCQVLEKDPSIRVVGEAVDGRSAVEMALKLHPDVIVMDVMLPKLNGVQATRRIVAHLPCVRVVGMSVFTHDEMAREMVAAGAQCYLAKGGPVEALLAAVKGQLEDARPTP